jgi:nitroreductase
MFFFKKDILFLFVGGLKMSVDIKGVRVQKYGASDLFRSRWSPRAMSGEVSEDELMTLFEAARWAPSSYNSQPWRFIFVMRNSDAWENFFDLLVDFNKSWAHNASALVLIVSRKNFEYNEEFSRTHSFDCGAAWMSLALEASLKGLVCHGIGGFDHEKARIVANIPEHFNIEAMVAVGKPGNTSVLPEDLQKVETISARKDLSELVFKGKLE